MLLRPGSFSFDRPFAEQDWSSKSAEVGRRFYRDRHGWRVVTYITKLRQRFTRAPTDTRPRQYLPVADAGPDPRQSAPVIARHKLPELYALAAVREEAFANGTAPPPGVTLSDPDTHRGQAAGYEAASTALQSHRRLSDAVDMLRRLMQRLELRGDETIYPVRWREGYIRAVDEALHTIERTLAAEQFDLTRERRLERRVMRIEMGPEGR